MMSFSIYSYFSPQPGMRANTGLTMLNDALAGKILFFLHGGQSNTENVTGQINKYRKLYVVDKQKQKT